MQKKELKRRTQIKSRKKKIKKDNLKILLLVLAIIITIICFSYLGKTLTLLIAILLGIIIGIWFILSKKGKKRKKIISILLMIFLVLGITGLIAFSGFVVYIKTQADPKYDKKKLNTLEISRIYDMNGKEIVGINSIKNVYYTLSKTSIKTYHDEYKIFYPYNQKVIEDL